MAKMDRCAKIEKINAEIARMEVESELLSDKDRYDVGLGSSYFSDLSKFNPFGGSKPKVQPIVPVSAEEVEHEKAQFVEMIMNPALAELAVIPNVMLTGPTGIVAVGQEVVPSKLNTIFTIPSMMQPQAGYGIEFSNFSLKVYVLLYVNSGGVSFSVAPGAANGKAQLSSERTVAYRLITAVKGPKQSWEMQQGNLTSAIRKIVNKNKK